MTFKICPYCHRPLDSCICEDNDSDEVRFTDRTFALSKLHKGTSRMGIQKSEDEIKFDLLRVLNDAGDRWEALLDAARELRGSHGYSMMQGATLALKWAHDYGYMPEHCGVCIDVSPVEPSSQQAA